MTTLHNFCITSTLHNFLMPPNVLYSATVIYLYSIVYKSTGQKRKRVEVKFEGPVPFLLWNGSEKLCLRKVSIANHCTKRQRENLTLAKHVTTTCSIIHTCVSNVTSLGSNVARAITDVTWVKDCRLRTSIFDTLFTMESLICRNRPTCSLLV